MMVRKRNAPSGPVMTRPRYRKPTLSYSPFSSAGQRSTDIPVAYVCGVHQLRFPAREREAQYLQQLRCYTGASDAESGCRKNIDCNSALSLCVWQTSRSKGSDDGIVSSQHQVDHNDLDQTRSVGDLSIPYWGQNLIPPRCSLRKRAGTSTVTR
jgi:hypothetical protein